MVVRIAVVEDDDAEAKTISDYISRFQKESRDVFKVARFWDGDEITSDYRPDYDIIFLDIRMKGIDGITAARYIRRMDNDVALIFITHMAQYAIKGYSVGALDFLPKPVSYFSFSQQLKRSIEHIKRCKDNMYILLPTENGVVKMDVARVLFIESFKHKMTVHTKDGEYHLISTMKDLESRLAGRGFFRSDNSFLVNLAHVKAVEGSLVILDSAGLNVSRSRKTSFLQALAAYVGNNGNGARRRP
ncbi:MAG: LytTR family DNA-binding domain-containing protein [Clostridiales bacterium]|jgi:DNA-binding LytR/AlgR family response regulator|nr:LytTR family DNA-binding domain-containing protein [Clostridiales bacterium]